MAINEFNIYKKEDEPFVTAFSYIPDASLTFPDTDINFSSPTVVSVPIDLKVNNTLFWHDYEKWKLTITVIMGACPAGGKGFVAGIKSDTPSNFIYGIGVETIIANKIRIYWWNDNAKQLVFKDMSSAYTPGDVVTFIAERNIDVMTFTAISSTQTISATYFASELQSRLATTEFPNLVQKFQLLFKQGNFTVTDLHIESNTGGADLMIAGDSITQGFGAISTSQIWSQQIKNTYPLTTVFAGGGTNTALFLKTIPAIILAHPKQVALNLGINDINGGVSLATLETNYASIISQLVTAGITPVIELVTPGTNGNIATFNTWLKATYSSTYNIVDFYSALKDQVSAGLDTRYTFDNLHLNQDGQNIQRDIFLRQFKPIDAPIVTSMRLIDAHIVRVVFNRPTITTGAGWHFRIAGLYNNVTSVTGSGTDTIDFTFTSTALSGISAYTGGYESFLGNAVSDAGYTLQSFKDTNLIAF